MSSLEELRALPQHVVQVRLRHRLDEQPARGKISPDWRYLAAAHERMAAEHRAEGTGQGAGYGDGWLWPCWVRSRRPSTTTEHRASVWRRRPAAGRRTADARARHCGCKDG